MSMPSADALPDPIPSASGVGGAARAPAGFQVRGGSFTLLVLRLTDPKDAAMFKFLADKVAQAPNFFRHAPVVVDLQDLETAPAFNIAELGRRLRQHQLILVGVQNGTDAQNRAALNAGLCLFPEGRKAPLAHAAEAVTAPAATAPAAGSPAARDVTSPPPPAAPPAAAAPPFVAPSAPPAVAPSESERGRTAQLVTQPVRSGQRIYAQGGDLVVLTSISPGAELLADGHIHVYGTLRGRALAGVSGDTAARIFCHGLEAELISIAGFWQVREDLPESLIGKPVQIALAGERLAIEPLP
jgi:septum site-determining protein MinC